MVASGPLCSRFHPSNATPFTVAADLEVKEQHMNQLANTQGAAAAPQDDPEGLAFVEDALGEADAMASVADPAYTFSQALVADEEINNG